MKVKTKFLRKDKLTSQQGITLIALIVTIIVLLILAGVSLKLVAGSDGILGKAEKAVNQYQIGEEKEILGLSYSAVYMKDVLEETGITPELLQAEIEQNGKKATVNARESNKKVLIVVFEKTKNVYEINIDTGEIKFLGQYTGDHSSEDLTEGDIKFSSTPGAGEYTNDKVETTISIGEGIDTTNLYLEYAIEDPLVESNWQEYTEKITSTKNQTIYARIKDKITGETKCQATTNIGNIDKEPPTGTLTIKNKTTSKVTLEVRASDNPSGSSQIAVSGIKGYYFSKDNGATYTDITTETSYTFEGLTQNEEYKFKVKIEDNVGNTREVVTAGNTELINGTITFGAATWSGTTATVAITGEQEGCVLKYYAGATIPDLSKETVAGWTTIESGKTVTTTSNTYIVAVLWDETNYGAKWATEKILRPGTISYNANGGTGGPSSQTVSHTQTATVNFTTLPTRTGYTFKGWSTDKNATSATYTSSGTKTFTMGTSDVTLYAVWSVNSYTFTLASGTGISTTGSTATGTYAYGTTITLKATVSEGWTWNKWTSSNESLVASSTTANITFKMPAGNITMTPSAKTSTYTIYYNANGGSGAPSSQTAVYSQPVTVSFSPTPTKSGSVFVGWSTDQNATTAMYTSSGTKSFTMGASDVTLYAVWHTHTGSSASGGGCYGKLCTGTKTCGGSIRENSYEQYDACGSSSYNEIKCGGTEWTYDSYTWAGDSTVYLLYRCNKCTVNCIPLATITGQNKDNDPGADYWRNVAAHMSSPTSVCTGPAYECKLCGAKYTYPEHSSLDLFECTNSVLFEFTNYICNSCGMSYSSNPGTCSASTSYNYYERNCGY